MATEDAAIPKSPWLQAGGLAFLALYAVAILVAASWLVSNVRRIPPANRAVVARMGKLDRVQDAGLLLAWPRPFEEVLLLPSSETVLEHDVATPSLPAQPAGAVDEERFEESDVTTQTGSMTDALASVGNRLTGDAGVVQMDIKLFYTVVDPYEYLLQQSHLSAALDRLVSRSVITVCASRDLDAILVARPELLGAEASLSEQRERLRGDVMDNINRYLAQLHSSGAGMGIQLARVDVTTRLHPETIEAFNSVLTTSQEALQEIANARTEAARTLQEANEAGDRTVQVAQAQASERVSKAQADTSDVLRLSQALKDRTDAGLLTRIYRERMAAILAKTQSVTMVNPKDDSRLILRGAGQ